MNLTTINDVTQGHGLAKHICELLLLLLWRFLAISKTNTQDDNDVGARMLPK